MSLVRSLVGSFFSILAVEQSRHNGFDSKNDKTELKALDFERESPVDVVDDVSLRFHLPDLSLVLRNPENIFSARGNSTEIGNKNEPFRKCCIR